MQTLLISLIVILLSIIHTTHSAGIECNAKNELKLDNIINSIYLWGDEKRVYPEDKAGLKPFCSANNEYQKWIKEYSNKCTKGLSKQVLGLMMYSAVKNTNNICKSSKRSAEFLKLGVCGNNAKSGTATCWRTMVKALDGAVSLTGAQDKLKMPMICCHYYIFKGCTQKTYESIPDKCDAQSIDGHEKLMNAFALDTLKLLCADYGEDSDKCDKVIPNTPPSKSKTLPKSPIIPVIKILDSIGKEE